MDSEKRQRIEHIVQSALGREPGLRGSYLDAVCGQDPDLRQQVELQLTATLTAPGQPAMQTVDGKRGILLAAGDRLGPYEVVGPLGSGGMGVVYRGIDTRLGRPVAIKFSSEQFSNRFAREAHVISALNHPQICTLYDIGSLPTGASYLVTEFVDGETLKDWLNHSPAFERKFEVARQILEALRAAHEAGIVHRDLKPGNIMVRSDGYVKVLDFGLAKRMPAGGTAGHDDTATVPGQILGTVAYMCPEQILGKEVDARGDLFAFGIILYEMVSGRHPWRRNSAVDTMHAILHEEPEATQTDLAGVIEKLLQKNPEERYSSASDVLDALVRPAPREAPRKALTRLIVLPFRALNQSEASDFLSVSLPDAITCSLAAVDSLVVRSTMTASRFAANPQLDLRSIAHQAEVDAILTGTLVSDGKQVRVNTQLVQAADGAVLWTNTANVSIQNLFDVQDQIVHRIVQSLALPLSAREQRALKHDVPANAAGYEFYLRANQLVAGGYNASNMMMARDLYLQSLDADPQYAPAWACLARTHRYIGKFVGDTTVNNNRAEDAFQKAFQLNPDLALTHNFYSAHECDSGRAPQAIERLIQRARTHRNDPNLLTGLVQALRYGNLLRESLAAHTLAIRLDPQAKTSVAYTYIHLGEFQKALDHCPTPSDFYVMGPALEALGRPQEAIALARQFEKTFPPPYNLWFSAWLDFFTVSHEKGAQTFDRGPELTDPEARFFNACLAAKGNQRERAMELLSLSLDHGYACHHALLHDRWLESLRIDARFPVLVERAAEMSKNARQVFDDNGGDRILGAS